MSRLEISILSAHCCVLPGERLVGAGMRGAGCRVLGLGWATCSSVHPSSLLLSLTLSLPSPPPHPPHPPPSLAAGNLFTVVVVGSIGSYLTHAQEFGFFTGMCLLSMLLLMWVGKSFTYVESCVDLAEQDTPWPPPSEAPSQPVSVPQARAAGGTLFDIEAGGSESPVEGQSPTVNLPSI